MSTGAIANGADIEGRTEYENGADYVLYKIAKELQISSKDIRLSGSSIRTKAEQLAQRIIDSLCNSKFKDSAGKIQRAIDAVKNKGYLLSYDFTGQKDVTAILILGEQAETVLKVLNKELERTKGCKHCTGERNIIKIDERTEAKIIDCFDGRFYLQVYGPEVMMDCPISVCPVCGRELKGAAV